MRCPATRFRYSAWLWPWPLLLVFFAGAIRVSAQSDSVPPAPRLSITRLAVPSAFVGLGLLSLTNAPVINRFSVRTDVLTAANGYRTTADEYLAFGPAVLLAGLTAAGVKGRSTPIDRAGYWLTANALAGVVTYGLKYTTGFIRPDGSDNHSFPSAHTAFAFAGAGVLDREFGATNVLIPITGYAIAGTTGYLRLVNDQHWVSDVLVGAGVGLLAAEAAYHVYPWVKRKLSRQLFRPRMGR